MSERGEGAEAPFAELEPLAETSGVQAPLGGPWSARLWDQLLGALPVLLMAVLAAFSWWLVKNTPVPGDPNAAAAPPHEPDYTMRDFALVSYAPDGSLRWRLEGEVLHHYPDTDTVEIDGVRMRAIDEAGRVTLGSARRAISNGDATQVRLMGQARVVREPPPGMPQGERVEIRGEFLELFTETDRVRSHLPVTLVTSGSELRAGSLDYSHLDRLARLGGRVTGVMQPGNAVR